MIVLTLLLIWALLFVCICIFSGLIFPVWMMVHAAKSKELTDLPKTIWIIVLIFLWTIAAIPYAIFASRSNRIKNLAIIQLVLLALFVGLYFYAGTLKTIAALVK